MQARYVGMFASLSLVSAAAAHAQTPVQSDLGRRLVADGYPIVIPQSQVDRVRSTRQQMRTTGYIERDAGVPRPEFAARAMETLQNAATDNRSGSSRHVNFVELSEFDETTLRVRVPRMPAQVLSADSRAYVLEANPNFVKSIYLDTSFGTVLIDDFSGGKVYADSEPDFLLVGQPAWLTVVKYPDGKWSTAIAVSANNGHLLIVECDQRLEGSDGDAFRQLVESLVLSTY